MADRDKIRAYMADGKIARPSTIAAAVGCSRTTVVRLVGRDLKPFAGGVILDAPHIIEPPELLAEAAFRMPGAVLWGVSAAAAHDLLDKDGTAPEAFLVSYNAGFPRIPGLTVTRTRDDRRLLLGVDEVPLASGLVLRVTSPARTVLDLITTGDGQAADALAMLSESGGDDAINEMANLASAFGTWPGLALALASLNKSREFRHHAF